MTTREELTEIFKQRGAHSIDFPDGWIPLLDNMNTELFRLDPDYRVSTVKVKFGGLRVYYTSGKDAEVERRMRALTLDTERMAARTCEVCSGPGVERTGHWILCDEHSDDRKAVSDED